jgi:hypothetical protein
MIPQRPESLKYFDLETKLASDAVYHYDYTRKDVYTSIRRKYHKGEIAPKN